MTKQKIISARYFTFKADNGQTINGYVIYSASEPNQYEMGLHIEKNTISEQKFNDFKLANAIAEGKYVIFFYNKFGKIEEVREA